ncbi:MAG: dTDP-4-dehydrorhamnose reductase [Pseudomonadota bacterium]
MKLLMFGRTGQVAAEVLRRAGQVQVVALSRDEADLADPVACAALITGTDADAVLNAAAWTNVDGAEANEAAASVINGAAPTAMAEAAAARDLPFIHISTDYVFDGSGTAPWQVGDAVAPINAYGWTKLAGERGVEAAGGPHAILRTSWVFSAHGANFVRTMLRVGASRERLTVVDDQIGGPTPAAAIADACITIAATFQSGGGQSGIYHLSGSPAVSWCDFARAIFAVAGMSTVAEPIPTTDYPTPAKRPLNSRLDCSAIGEAFGINVPDWRAGLSDVLEDLK